MFALSLITLFTLPVRADEVMSAPSLDARLERLEQIVRPVDVGTRVTLLGPVASKIYERTPGGPRLGLSTEFFTLRQGVATSEAEPSAARTNVANVRPTFGYRLHPRLLFNAQISFDTGGAEPSQTVTLRKGGAVVRFAYLDWFLNPRQESGVRVGHQLVPMGLTNTGADATTFFGVRRPPLEREVLPNDWHENGAVWWFDARQVILEAGVFNSLNARGFRGPTFVAGGRSLGQDAPTSDAMGIIRVNVRDAGWLAGGSFAIGGTAQGNPALNSARAQLGELHVRLERPRFALAAQLAQGRVTDAGPISAFNGTVLGSQASGVAAEGALEVLDDPNVKLWVFLRHSAYDLHAKVPAGYAADPTLDRLETTAGVHYLPLANLVVKGDVGLLSDAANGRTTEVSLGAGFLY